MESREKGMIIPNSLEGLVGYVETGKSVLFSTAGWCGDHRFIRPQTPGIEDDFSDWQFAEVDRNEYIDVTAEWNIFGISSFVVIQDRKELGCLVNKDREIKQEIESFLESIIKG